MTGKINIAVLLLMVASAARGQVASHASTVVPKQQARAAQPGDKPVARVNGVLLTDRDLLREEYAIFPYARQHNGAVPQEMEPQIRQGALQMIIFEELVYQEAERQKITIPTARLQNAETEFRKQFSTPEDYQSFLQAECHGSKRLLREKIQRSLLIDTLLKSEVDAKSGVSLAELRAYYIKNGARFEYPEAFAIQTISVLPPPNQNPTPEQQKEMRKRADDALRQAKVTGNYEEFGVLAEKISDDDYRVMMGDHRAVARTKLAPQVVEALLPLRAGQITGVIQVEQAYTIVRLNQHILAGKAKFEDVKDPLRKELKQKKTEQLRAALDKKLRQNAKIETL